MALQPAEQGLSFGRLTAVAVVGLLAGVGRAREPELRSVTPAVKRLEEYIRRRVAEFDQIPAERKTTLHGLAQHVHKRQAAKQPARLLFICTHNSRRSHLAQVWAAAAAAHYGVAGVETFSGGTEATAFNRRAVAALERAGFEIACEASAADNPRYRLRYSPRAEPLVCFSKEFSQPPNPRADFCAVLTCSQADKACPLVAGAADRIALPYDDPQTADATPRETAMYDARCAEIARELLFAFSLVADGAPL
jgi:protein-tyrosine-phosphatase